MQVLLLGMLCFMVFSLEPSDIASRVGELGRWQGGCKQGSHAGRVQLACTCCRSRGLGGGRAGGGRGHRLAVTMTGGTFRSLQPPAALLQAAAAAEYVGLTSRLPPSPPAAQACV